METHLLNFTNSSYTRKDSIVYSYTSNNIFRFIVFNINSPRKTIAIEIAWSNANRDPQQIKYNADFPTLRPSQWEERIGVGLMTAKHQISWHLLTAEDELRSTDAPHDAIDVCKSSFDAVDLDSIGIVMIGGEQKKAYVNAHYNLHDYSTEALLIYPAVDIVFQRIYPHILTFFQRSPP
jgi:hypothetical protein